ncbi:MAG: hypothetical protein RIC55_02545 [Pirellulaceae bacterium]
MAAQISSYLGKKWLDHIFQNATYTPPSGIYVALGTGDGDSFQEMTPSTTPYYRRQWIEFEESFATTEEAAQVNAALEKLNWPIARADWPERSTFALFDAHTGGNLLFWGFGGDVPIEKGETFYINSEATSLKIDYVLTEATDYLLQALFDHTLRGDTFSISNIYVGLLEDVGSRDGSYTEYSKSGYSRQLLNDWKNAADSADSTHPIEIFNNGVVTFGPAGANWTSPTPACLGIFDALSGGHLLYWGNNDISATILSGDALEYPANYIRVRFYHNVH